MSTIDEIQRERSEKVAKLRAKGIDPYPPESARDRSVSEFLKDFDSLLSEASVVTLAGRIMSTRLHGGAVFFDIFDGTNKVQVYLKKDDLKEGDFDAFVEAVDTGDFVDVAGIAFLTKRNERSLFGRSWRMLTKSLRPIPDAWYGLKDEEKRYRMRYLDILLNPVSADIVKKRSIFWNAFRTYLIDKGFIEVETPVLENTTGGAEARPFVTHHKALDIDLYLRISAGELWQKKLLVAGLPRVFEIGRIFRNEGMSNEHLQDYTQLEFYMAYADYKFGMDMTKDLYRTVAEKTFGTSKFTIKGFDIDLAGEWEIYDFCELIKKHYNLDPLEFTEEESDLNSKTLGKIEEALEKNEIPFDSMALSIERGVDLLWKKIRKSIGGPGFLVGVPVYMEPLAKRSAKNPKVVERFQVLIAGSEVGKGFSELNDPEDQKARFIKQQALREAGDEEAQMADMEFVEALEYGMPPAFGFGVSERLFSFLMDIDVREGQIFPLMRPKE